MLDIVRYCESKTGKQYTHHTKDVLHGACPICGGKDRFKINMAKTTKVGNTVITGKWFCENCKPIEGYMWNSFPDLIMEVENIDFKEALDFIGLENPYKEKQNFSFSASSKPLMPVSFVSEAKTPNIDVLNKIKYIASKSKEELEQAPKILKWLQSERKLKPETIKRFWLGYNKEHNNLVIPLFRHQRIEGLKFRTFNAEKAGYKYSNYKGTSPTPTRFNIPQEIYVVVESELDAILLAQEIPTNIPITPICLMGKGNKPNKELIEEIKKCALVLLWLDDDGKTENDIRNWIKYLDEININWVNLTELQPKNTGKDPTEFYKITGKSPIEVIKKAVDFNFYE